MTPIPVRHATHEVLNQPPALEDYNLFSTDRVLSEGVLREGAGWAVDELGAFGARVGTSEMIAHGFAANRYTPVLQTHDRFGRRLDVVEFHPSWHACFEVGVEGEVHALPWNRPRPGAHVARIAKHYMLSQIEAGVGCPLTMTFAVVPALRAEPSLAERWVPRVTSKVYDPRFIAASEKKGCLMGMALTEKQGGSDVRANTTRAVPVGAEGPGEAYLLTGHKFFCSDPMCDAFLLLGNAPKGLTCFLVPRWLEDGTQNEFRILRLKDKLGNRSNASSEIELDQTWGWMVGEEGRGVRTIIEMVSHTRLDCTIGSSSLMRGALVQAAHHVAHRAAFGKLLKDQPLMRNVIADLAVESEAATTLLLRMGRAYDEAAADPSQRAFVRITTAIGKYWICKRGPAMVAEALECLGGSGYVEESVISRIYREIPVSSVWEGSGNVMCLDVLRAMRREPETVPALLAELSKAKGLDARFDAHLSAVERELADPDDLEVRARRIVERLAVGLQAALLLQQGPDFVADAFCATRLTGEGTLQYGTLPRGTRFEALVERAMPTRP